MKDRDLNYLCGIYDLDTSSKDVDMDSFFNNTSELTDIIMSTGATNAHIRPSVMEIQQLQIEDSTIHLINCIVIYLIT